MATLIANADLCIGAAGTTSWEQCCLGLPALLVVLADNQLLVAESLEQSGAAINLGTVGDITAHDITEGITQLTHPDTYAKAVQAALAVTGGHGVRGFVGRLRARGTSIRTATSQDAELIWGWREHCDSHKFYRSAKKTELADHMKWKAVALDDPNKELCIAEREGWPTAHVRFDRDPQNSNICGVSIVVDPSLAERGFGRIALRSALDLMSATDNVAILAEVHEDNQASISLFEGRGFRPIKKTKSFVVMAYQQDKTASSRDQDA